MAEKQIIAGSGGFYFTNGRLVVSPIIDYIIKASKKDHPKFCSISTAQGDSESITSKLYDAMSERDVHTSHLALFPMPNHENIEEFLLAQDIIWVGGGSVANLLAVWETHGIFNILRKAWDKGTVLSGISAGSLCWNAAGTTDSFGLNLRPVINKNGLLPYSSGVHYDTEEQRRPLFQKLIAEDKIPEGYATDDGVSIHFVNTDIYKVISQTEGKNAYRVFKDDDGTVKEEVISPELLT